MRLDHLAFRVVDRNKTAKFFQEAMGYTLQQEFTIDFGGGQTAQCIALEPPEKMNTVLPPWTTESYLIPYCDSYHLPPEIFVSDGSPGSVVGDWVAARGVGGLHHMAYQVNDVAKTMQEWQEKGYAEFTTAQPITCPGLTQVFTKPSQLTGVIIEFIQREEFGFCKDNVKALMESTANF